MGFEEIFQGARATCIEMTGLRIDEQTQRGLPAAAGKYRAEKGIFDVQQLRAGHACHPSAAFG